LRSDGMDLRWVVRDEVAPSGVALILVARDGENAIAVAPGANGGLSVEDVRRARRVIERAAVLVVQLETPIRAVTEAVRLASAAAVPVILNPAPARRLPSRLLRCVAYLTPNETEAELLTGIRVNSEESAGRAATELRRRGVGTVILTLGARGALVASADLLVRVRGFRVRAVDTTAAGDVFNGALAVALSEGEPLMEAVRFANAAAAVSVTRAGAQPSVPCRAEIESMLERGLAKRLR
jgi:ribokinase